MNYSFIIVNCYIENSERDVLMVNLKKTGKWGLPGGKVEPGENPRNALLREVKEELGIDIEIEKLIGFREYFWESDNNYWTDLIYKAKIVRGNPEINEVEKILDLGWKEKSNLPEGTNIF